MAEQGASGTRRRSRSTPAMQVQAASMMGGGMRAADAAAELGVTEASVRQWMRKPRLQEIYRETVAALSFERYSRAVRVVDDQMEHDNPFVAQQAARIVIEQTKAVALDVDNNTVTVVIQGAPEIGMPDDT